MLELMFLLIIGIFGMLLILTPVFAVGAMISLPAVEKIKDKVALDLKIH